MKPVKKGFVLQMQISILSLALRYSADMFINMLKTKLNGFLQNGFKYRKISQLFEEFPRKSETNAFKSIICRREPFGHLRAKIVIVGSNT